ncbi:MAG: hypothetical protein ACRD0P_37235 [Stackebrandtia sp.]
MNQPLKAISVQQPWAWAITHAGKNVENRTSNTHYRGRLAVHAPQHVRRDDIDALRLAGFHVPTELIVGAIIAVTTLADAHPAADCGGTCSPWAESGRNVWHWRLEKTTPTSPIACPGKRNVWPLPVDIHEEVVAAIDEGTTS